MLTAVAATLLAFLAAAGGGAGTELEIRVWDEGRDARPSRTFTLRCDPAGGTLPRPAAACRRLATTRDPFAPVPEDAVCTQVYGGPQEALVTGRHRGRAVRVALSLRDGCEIERWRRLDFLTPGSGAGRGPS